MRLLPVVEHKPQMVVLVVEVTGSHLPQERELQVRAVTADLECQVSAEELLAAGVVAAAAVLVVPA